MESANTQCARLQQDHRVDDSWYCRPGAKAVEELESEYAAALKHAERTMKELQATSHAAGPPSRCLRSRIVLALRLLGTCCQGSEAAWFAAGAYG